METILRLFLNREQEKKLNFQFSMNKHWYSKDLWGRIWIIPRFTIQTTNLRRKKKKMKTNQEIKKLI